jgi:hypothetical protein
MLESFSSFLETDEIDIDMNSIKIIIQNNLQSLYDKVEDYYPLNQDPRDRYLWVQNPFVADSQHKLCLKKRRTFIKIIIRYWSAI